MAKLSDSSDSGIPSYTAKELSTFLTYVFSDYFNRNGFMHIRKCFAEQYATIELHLKMNTFMKYKKLLDLLKPSVSISIWYNKYLFNKIPRRALLIYIENRSRASSIDPRNINVPQYFIKIKSQLRHCGLNIYNIKLFSTVKKLHCTAVFSETLHVVYIH